MNPFTSFNSKVNMSNLTPYLTLVKNVISTAKVGDYLSTGTVIRKSKVARDLVKDSLIKEALNSFVISGNLKKTAFGLYYEVISTKVD